MALIFPNHPPRERAKRYRALAHDAHRGVRGSTGKARDSWVHMERQWEDLALQSDAAAERVELDHQSERR
jgi:hypothetical protein